MRRHVLLGIVALLVSAPVVHAQVPQGWTGVWAGATRNPPPGVPPAELPYDDLEKAILEHLQPWALAKYEATEWNIDDTGQVCKLDGIFRQGHEGSAGFRFVEGPGKLYQLWSPEIHGLKPIHLNSPHPRNLTPTWNGDARGRWDGDTLVVDIVGFNDKSWLGSDRQPHTEELHVIERYRLFGGGAFMELRVIVDDRKAFTSPYTYTRYYRKMPAGTDSQESICNVVMAGENLWRRRRDGLLAEHQAALDAYVSTLAALPVPAIAGPLPPPAPPRVPAASAAAVVPRPIPAAMRSLAGIYALLPSGAAAPGGLKAAGDLAGLPLLPPALATARARNLKNDSAKHCQAIGPFRMMAHEGTRLELLVSTERMTMLFENTALGNRREISMTRQHPAIVAPTWLGDSIGTWDGDALVVDSVGFNDRTWLNDAGAPHSDRLHLVERYRLMQSGAVLEVQVTATDPGVLAQPFTYTRYYARQDSPLREDFCQETD